MAKQSLRALACCLVALVACSSEPDDPTFKPMDEAGLPLQRVGAWKITNKVTGETFDECITPDTHARIRSNLHPTGMCSSRYKRDGTTLIVRTTCAMNWVTIFTNSYDGDLNTRYTLTTSEKSIASKRMNPYLPDDGPPVSFNAEYVGETCADGAYRP